MHDLPFAIPESLASYVVQYETDPDKTIRRLKKQLKKRGPDAVGYFLLGWFYYRKGLQEKAVSCALKAKTFAPGSPFFHKLHYFFNHPEMFEAWRSHSDYKSMARSSFRSATAAGSITDLNTLIEKLSKIDSRRLQDGYAPSPDSDSESGSDLSADAEDVDDITSETLAKIHEQQGKYDAAINAYKRLKRIHPEKSDHYDEEVERLTELKNTSDSD